jgi:hypothetical protein
VDRAARTPLLARPTNLATLPQLVEEQ